jgi:transposase-like protein
MFASNDARQNGLAPEFGVAEAMKHKWVRGADMTHSDDHARKCFEKYPEWKKRFLTKAVPVHVPYNANKQGTCTFMFVPPYCEQNAA